MPPPQRPPKLDDEVLTQRVRDAAASGRYRILPHARQRCDERDVSAVDIAHALAQGHRVRARDRFEQAWRAWSYCFEGKTVDDERLRVIVAFDDWVLIVTVVRLGDHKER